MNICYRAQQREGRLDAAAAALAAGALDSAIDALRAHQAIEPGSIDAAMLWTQVQMARGVWDQAAGLLQTLWQHCPEDAATYALASHVLEHAKQPTEAAWRARQALVFENRRPEYWARYEALHARPSWPQAYDVVFYSGHPCAAPLPPPSAVLTQAMGGSETMVLLMARALAARGLRVALCGNYAESCVDAGVQCLPLEDFFLLQRYAEIPIAIVSRFVQPYLNQCSAQHRVFWLHDIVAPSYAPVYAQLDAQVDRYWALSQYQEDLYVERCGLDRAKFWRTTNAVDPAWLPPYKPCGERIPGRCMYISRPERGLREALVCFRALQAQRSDATLHVCTYSAGAVLDDPEIQPLRAELTATPGVTVSCLDKTELLNALSQAMVLLYPNSSDKETSCLAAIEAQMLGTPVVTTDRGCLRETMAPHAGAVVPWPAAAPCPVDALVSAAATLLRDPQQWTKQSTAARTHALAYHAVDVVAETWGEYLNNL